MKICSSLVLAVNQLWTHAGDTLGILACRCAKDGLDDSSDSELAPHDAHEQAKTELGSPTEPPVSNRSDATTVSSPESTGGLDDQELLATNSVPVPDSVLVSASVPAALSDDERRPVRCADPEREPNLEGDAETTDIGAAAVALARRLVPLTTATGRFMLEAKLPGDVTTSDQRQCYLAAKAAFTNATRDYVVACAERDEASESADDITTLVEAYARLTSSPLFEEEQRARDLQWEEAHAEVNPAAFLLVSLTTQEPETEPLITTVAPVSGQRPLTALEQRLDGAHALALFRKTPEQLARAPASAFLGVDMDDLCLLELRALLHAAGSSKTDDRAWRYQVQDVVRTAKKRFDDSRRAHLSDERGSSRSCFFYGPASEQVLPLYAAPKLEDALTGYCDAETATH